MNAHRSAGRGFSLIEMMIVVAIVAILAAIAIPSYQDSVRKGARTEGKAALMRALQAEERYYTANNTYIGYTNSPPSGAFPTFSGDNLNNSRYTISVQAGALTGLCTDNDITKCAVAVAQVRNTNSDSVCGTMAADSVGNRYPANSVCWR